MCQELGAYTGLSGVRRVFEARSKGARAKDALFPSDSGNALSRDQWIALLSSLAKPGEHTPRRIGAQLLARLRVPLEIIKFQGRWGSDVIEKYVEHAYEDYAAGLGL